MTSILNDMAKMFDERLRQLLVDTLDTCYRGGLGSTTSMQVIFSIMMAELAAGAATLKLTEDEFAETARMAHRAMRIVMARDRKKSNPAKTKH